MMLKADLQLAAEERAFGEESGGVMDDSIGGVEIGRRTLRVIDAIALPLLLMWPVFQFLGGRSLVVWTVSGLLGVWLVRRLIRAADWHAPYRMRFLALIVFACAASWTAALIHSAFA
jgi:hypothetical protein